MVLFPPVLAVTLGVVGAALVVRHFMREWQREAELEKAKQAPRAESKNDMPKKLRRDPDGIYRP